MESVFNDHETEQEFHERGYVVRPFLSEDELKAVRRLYEELSPDSSTGFHATVLDKNRDYRWRASKGLQAIVQHRLATMVPQYKVVLGAFVTKPARSQGGFVPLHQDWWIVDNRVHRAVQFWCPLIDVGVHNACLKVVPGSHRLFNNPYPIHSRYRTAYHPVLKALETSCAIHVPMSAGSALIYDQRMLHGSDDNHGDQLRLAFNCVTIPQGLTPHLYYWNGNTTSELDVLEVTEEFLCQFQYDAPLEAPYPPGVRYLESIHVSVQPPKPEALTELQRSQAHRS